MLPIEEQDLLKQKEITDAHHLRCAALDGCVCEVCQATLAVCRDYEKPILRLLALCAQWLPYPSNLREAAFRVALDGADAEETLKALP